MHKREKYFGVFLYVIIIRKSRKYKLGWANSQFSNGLMTNFSKVITANQTGPHICRLLGSTETAEKASDPSQMGFSNAELLGAGSPFPQTGCHRDMCPATIHLLGTWMTLCRLTPHHVAFGGSSIHRHCSDYNSSVHLQSYQQQNPYRRSTQAVGICLPPTAPPSPQHDVWGVDKHLSRHGDLCAVSTQIEPSGYEFWPTIIKLAFYCSIWAMSEGEEACTGQE